MFFYYIFAHLAHLFDLFLPNKQFFSNFWLVLSPHAPNPVGSCLPRGFSGSSESVFGGHRPLPHFFFFLAQEKVRMGGALDAFLPHPLNCLDPPLLLGHSDRVIPQCCQHYQHRQDCTDSVKHQTPHRLPRPPWPPRLPVPTNLSSLTYSPMLTCVQKDTSSKRDALKVSASSIRH